MKSRIDYTRKPLLVPAPTVTLELDIDEFAAIVRVLHKGMSGAPHEARQVRKRIEVGIDEAITALPDGWRPLVVAARDRHADDIVEAIGATFDGLPTRWPP